MGYNLQMSKLATWISEQPEPVAELAARLGVHRVTLHHYASGRKLPGLRMSVRIEEVTDGAVTVADLIAAHRA